MYTGLPRPVPLGGGQKPYFLAPPPRKVCLLTVPLYGVRRQDRRVCMVICKWEGIFIAPNFFYFLVVKNR